MCLEKYRCYLTLSLILLELCVLLTCLLDLDAPYYLSVYKCVKLTSFFSPTFV